MLVISNYYLLGIEDFNLVLRQIPVEVEYATIAQLDDSIEHGARVQRVDNLESSGCDLAIDTHRGTDLESGARLHGSVDVERRW